MRTVRLAFRSLSRTPIVSLVVVLSLGLGIGANTAIFSLLYQIMLRTLPVQRSHELVTITSPEDFKGGRQSTNDSGGTESVFSYPMFRELEKNAQGLTALAGHRLVSANLSLQGKTLDGTVSLVSGQFFPILGIEPLLGRMLAPEDDRGAGQAVVVLGYGYWNDRLGGREDVLNKPLRVNGQLFTIVGVAPKTFTGMTMGSTPDVYVPMVFKPAMTPGWNGTDRYADYWVYLFGRRRPELTVAQAQDRLNSIYAGLVEKQARDVKGRDASYIERFAKSRLTLEQGSLGQSRMREQSREPLLILLACTALVLLIASANAANLLLARAAQRQRELAIRASLGAGRRHILKQLLAEALLLSFGGGLAGVLIALWTLDSLMRFMATDNAPIYYLTTGLQWPVLIFTFGVALLTGLLFGLYPAWSAARSSVADTLKEASNNSSASTGGVRVRKAIVCAQVAFSVLLLIPMGLFLKSLVNLVRVDLGIRTENLVTFSVSPHLNGYTPERIQSLYTQMEERLSAIPGVRSATVSSVPLISGSNWGNSLLVEGYRQDPEADNHSMTNSIGPGFFGKMGVPLIQGREISDADTQASPHVAIVNETWAKHFFPNGNAVGRTFKEGDPKGPLVHVIGVVKDTKYSSVRQTPPRLYYTAYRQSERLGGVSFYVRSALPADQAVNQIRRLMREIDGDLPLESLRTMQEQVKMNIRSDRMVLTLASAFGILATLLSMLGLYGVMAYGVVRRTREIGIRMALGAASDSIRTLVLREVGVILGVGLVIGLPAAIGLARLTESQLFGVKSFDLAVIGGAVAALALASFLAGYLPAWRASRINPIQALRYE